MPLCGQFFWFPGCVRFIFEEKSLIDIVTPCLLVVSAMCTSKAIPFASSTNVAQGPWPLSLNSTNREALRNYLACQNIKVTVIWLAFFVAYDLSFCARRCSVFGTGSSFSAYDLWIYARRGTVFNGCPRVSRNG